MVERSLRRGKAHSGINQGCVAALRDLPGCRRGWGRFEEGLTHVMLLLELDLDDWDSNPSWASFWASYPASLCLSFLV